MSLSYRSRSGGLLELVCCLAPLGFVFAAPVEFSQSSQPQFFSSSVYVETDTIVSTTNAPLASSGYSFTHWTIDGSRTNDLLGRALNPVAFTIYEPISAVAWYMDSTNDLDADGIADWYELLFYSNTNNAPLSDTDGDGLDLDVEYRRDYHPGLKDIIDDGGVSRRRSLKTLLILVPEHHAYTETSIPDGFVVFETAISNGLSVVSTNLHGDTTGYSFIYWDVNGETMVDSLGVALSRVITVVTGATIVTAHYVDSTNDFDLDGLSDWWELYNFTSMTNDPAGDADGDGIDEGAEYRRDYNPRLSDLIEDGGISRRRSELVAVNLGDYVSYEITSQPLGLIASQSGYAVTGTVVTTPNISLATAQTGYMFTQWLLNGVRQEDASGRALSRLQIEMTTNIVAVAQYVDAEADADDDGLPDWWEWQNFGSMANNGSTDTDGDGVDLDTEYRRDYLPGIGDIVEDGGISRRRSERLFVNMQFFERVEYVMQDGILTNFFTVWPTTVTGMDFGDNSCAAVGDWDGDGRLDIFVGSGTGQMRMFRNIGTPHTLNLSDVTIAFAGISAGWTGISNPHPALGDFSGDGKADLALGGNSGIIRLISSPGNFDNPQSPAVNYEISVSNATVALPAFCDITGDGFKDLLVLVNDGTVRAHIHSGNTSVPYDEGSFTNSILEMGVPLASGISAGDINDDGIVDVLVSDSEGRIWEFHGSAGGFFELKSKVWGGSGRGMAANLTVGLGDFDDDGDLDSICGFAGGGLLFLRDPKLGRPGNLIAMAGALSVDLTWDPNEEYRIKGYYVYRDEILDGAFSRVTDPKLAFPGYLDETVVPGLAYFYRVTSVSHLIMPGNSLPMELESEPSDVVSGMVGRVVLTMPDYAGAAGTTVVSSVSIANARDITGDSLEIRISYDPLVIKPACQVIPGAQTVELSAMAQQIILADNSETADGELVVQGSGAGEMIGEGRIFDICWFITNSVANGTMTTNTFVSAVLKDTQGNMLNVDSADEAVLTVQAAYARGDANGDGVLTMDDFHEVMKMAIGKITPNASQIMACDLNGNGIVDKDDAHLLNRMIHDLRINP